MTKRKVGNISYHIITDTQKGKETRNDELLRQLQKKGIKLNYKNGMEFFLQNQRKPIHLIFN